MGDYNGIDCPICHKPLTDDIAICPDCGAPYHRKCIVSMGTCVFGDLHDKKQAWRPPDAPSTELEQGADRLGSGESTHNQHKCAKCGVANPENGLFCEVCGAPLDKLGHANNVSAPQSDTTFSSTLNSSWNNGTDRQTTFTQSTKALFATPLGGLDSDEEIEGVPVKDLAIFVGQSVPYFLPIFKKQSEKKSKLIQFNLPAALFQSYYLFYRKMYLFGFLTFLAITLLAVPSLLLLLDEMRARLIGPAIAPWFDSSSMAPLIQVCSIIAFVVRIAISLFFNKLYQAHVITKIKKIQKQKLSHQEYVVALTKYGSVSMRMVLLFIGFFILISYVGMFFILR